MNINDFIAGKKITEEDIERLKKNRENNPYLGTMDQMVSGDGKIQSFLLGGAMMAKGNGSVQPEAPECPEKDEGEGHV